MERDPSSGAIVVDPARFPSGLAAVAEWLHSPARDFKFGVYTAARSLTCQAR